MKKQKIITPRYAIGSLFLAIILPLLPLLITRQWNWWEAWAFAGVCILAFVISRWMAVQRHPDILVERGKILQQEDAKAWDKLLTPLWVILFGMAIVVAGVDRLFGWFPKFHVAVSILSLLIFLAGYIFGSWALIENRFFSGMNRIQTERGHQVVSSGPYAYVRHPGYAGPLLAYTVMPIILGSWWAILPIVALIIVGIVRTSLEDKMLLQELSGYREYSQRVRYRLLPGVW